MSSNYTSNYSTNATNINSTAPSPFRGPFSREDIKLITTVFFSIIGSLGTVGNSLVILTVVRWLDMRTPCNLFIANISFADLIVSLVMSPLRIIEQHTGGWIFGKVLCYVLAPFQDTLGSASVLSHTAIALERYRAIVAPFKPRLNKRQVKITILFIWVFCYLCTSFPLLFFINFELRNGVQICRVSFPKEDRYIFPLYLAVVFILSPLICQVCCYIMIIRVLRKKDAIQDHQESTVTSAQIQIQTSRQRARAKKRLIRRLIVLRLIFQFCSLPR
nr:neuromedin-U receptor 2 [Haliclona caerulea]